MCVFTGLFKLGWSLVTLSKSKILKIMNDTEILQISDRRKVSLIEIVHNLAKKNRKIPESQDKWSESG